MTDAKWGAQCQTYATWQVQDAVRKNKCTAERAEMISEISRLTAAVAHLTGASHAAQIQATAEVLSAKDAEIGMREGERDRFMWQLVHETLRPHNHGGGSWRELYQQAEPLIRQLVAALKDEEQRCAKFDRHFWGAEALETARRAGFG